MKCKSKELSSEDLQVEKYRQETTLVVILEKKNFLNWRFEKVLAKPSTLVVGICGFGHIYWKNP